MSTDLDRIPAPYRERVQRVLDAATKGAIGVRAYHELRAAALAPFLVIADEADAVRARVSPEFATKSTPPLKIGEAAEAAAMKVWTRRMAEHGEHLAPPADAMRAEADEQRDPMAATMMRMTASAWTSAAAAPEDDTVPPDLAPEGFFFGTVSVNGEMVINDGQGAQAALDGLVRYLETHVSAMPVDLVQRAILALSMTLPAGPLAPTPEPVATLGVIVSLLRTLPIGRMPTVCLGGGAAGYELLAARDGARTFTIAGTDETPPLRCVYVEYDGIEIKARCTRDEVP